RTYDIPHSKRTAVSVDTLLDWALRYRTGGFEALAPKPRQDRGQSRAVTPQLASLIERLKRENPHRTGTTLLRELALSSGQDTPALSASTLYRFLKQRGLSEKQLLAPQAHKKYEPEGRGKIERFFRTVRDQFLANLDPKHALSLEELNERLWIWIESVYHRSEHSALGSTPLARWQRDIEQIRQLPPATDLRRLFFHRLDRVVRRDSTFLLHNRLYEAPPHLAGHTVEVRFDPLDAAEVEIWFQGK